MKYLLDLISQPSSWRGVVYVLTACGVYLSPNDQTTIISAGLGLAGLIGMFFSDAKVIEVPPTGE